VAVALTNKLIIDPDHDNSPLGSPNGFGLYEPVPIDI
jgi:hypothetical protein